MSRRRIAVAAATVVVALVVVAAVVAFSRGSGDSPAPVTAGSAPSSSAPPRVGAGASEVLSRPRDTWLSGVNGYPRLDAASVLAFCEARGRECPLAHTYTDRATYQSMTTDSSWVFAYFADFPGALVISQGLTPEKRPQDLAGCASGEFDSRWQDFGAVMTRTGRADSIVRLGWEFNGSFMPWNGSDTDTWIACYRRAADNIRKTNPGVILDWTINAHGTTAGICGGVSTNCYPGDDYVDIIGIDNYDHYPASRSRAEFDRTAAAPEGLDWLLAFAKQRGKPFSVGEWGVVPTGDAGRENPDFIRWMHDWFTTNQASLAYEAYFSDCTAGGVQSSLFRQEAPCRPNPGSSAVYRQLWGS